MHRLKSIILSVALAMTLQVLAGGRVFAGFTVAGGSTVTFASGEELRTSAMAVSAAGVLNGGGARLYVEGDWLNAGVFNAQSSTVAFINAAAASTIAGDNTFYSLSLSSAGKTIYFTAGSTQTVAGLFAADGAAGSLVRLRSTADGNKWAIGFTGGQQLVTYLDVKDSAALYNPVRAHYSVDSGNSNANWVWGPAITNNQASPTPWYTADPGAVFDVDFSDLVGFTTAQYRVTSAAAGGGTVLKGWTDIYANPAGVTSYTADWTVDFAALREGPNYVSVRVFDTVGFSSSAVDAFVIRKDTSTPSVINNQAGDDAWRSAAGTLYNVDFADDGSGVVSAQYRATSQPSGGGAVVLDWTDIVAATSTALYSPDWGVDFAALPSDATSYVSVRAYDLTGKSTTYYDAFYVKKDVAAPWITDNQPDDLWRFADPGAIYDVDFADSGGSKLDRAQYSISSSAALGDGSVKGWTDIAVNISSNGYTQNWGVDFVAARAGINYVSARVYDNAGNYAQTNDIFTVSKDTTSPVITDNQSGDDVWRSAAGTLYNVDFADALSGLSTAQYRITSQPGQAGTVLKDWTDIYSNPAGTPAYTTDWPVDFAAMQEGGGNYVSVRAYDLAGKSALSQDVFYVKKDTTPPSSAAITDFTAAGTDLTLTGAGADALSGVGGYSFWISPQPDFSAGVSSTAYSASQTALFGGVQEATTYYARLYVRDNALNVAYSVNASTLTRGVVHVSSQSLAPAAAMQGAEAAMLSVDLRTNPGRSATLDRLTITKGTSTASSSDISAVRVYKDVNGDGALDGGDALLGSGVFSGVSAAVTLSVPLPVAETAGRIIVSYVFSSGAAVDATAKAEITSPSGLVFPDPYAAAGDFPLGSGFTRITDGANTLNITPVSAAPSIVPPGTANIGMIKLQMQTNTGTSIVDKLRVSLGGTVASNNVPFVKVYRDANGNAQFDAVGDALLSSGVDVFTDLSSTITLTASAANRTVGTTPVYMFVVVDVAADAPEGSSFSITVATSSSFTLANPADTPVMVPETFTSGSVTVQTDNTANINIVGIVPAQMAQGGLYAVALASCSADVGIAELNRVKVNRIGSSVDSDIRSVRIYKDQVQDGGGFNPSYDLLLGSAAVSGGVAVVDISTLTLSAPATSVIFVVYEVSPTAAAGNTLGAGFTNNDYFRMASPNTAVYGNFPFNTGTGAVQATVNPLLVWSAQDVTTGEMFQGTQNNPVLKLKVRSELNTVNWTALRLKKTGTAPDSFVTAVKVYRDADADDMLGAGDELISGGGDVFVSGESNIFFALPQTVDTAGGTYFAALSLLADAAHGSTVGVEVTTTSWLSVNSPNHVSTASVAAPYIGGPTTIKQYPNIVAVSTAGIAPAAGVYPGAADIPVLKLNFKTDVSAADLLSVKFSKTGTLTDGEVSSVKIYYDANNLGTFDRDNLAAYVLVTKSTVSFGTDGQLNIALLDLQSNKLIDTAGRNYFVAIDLAAAAVIGRSMVMRVLDNSYITVSAPNSVAATAFNSQTVAVMAPPQTLTVAFENKLSTYAVQGQNSVLVASFTVSASSYTISLSQIRAARGGTGSDGDISSFKLYRDNGNGTWDGIAGETLLQAVAFSGGVAAFAPAAQAIASPGAYTYYFVADISETAQQGRTFGVDMPAAGYFTVDDPHSVSNAAFPFTGGRATIEATVDTMIVETVNSAPALRQADSNKVMGRLRLKTDTRSAALSSIRFDKSGTTSDADIYRIRLYKDDGDLSLGAGDALVGTLSALAGGSGVMIISPAQSITTTPADYFVTVDIATYAVVGTTFSLTAAPSAVSPDVVAYKDGITPLFTMAGSIQDDPDTVYLSFTNLSLQSIYLGASGNKMARISLWTGQDQALLTDLKLTFSGTAGPSDIPLVKLYRDTDGSGYFDPAYDALAASGVISAGEATMHLPGSGDVITASTRTYFAVIDVSASAAIGNSVALGIPSAASVYLAGSDIVADFTAKLSETATIRDPRIPTPPDIRVYKADSTLYGENDTSFNPYRTLLKFRWSSTAGQGSVGDVYYYIGSVPADESTPAGSWVSVEAGAGADITVRSLSLLNNGNYYLSVKTRNSLGAFYSDIVSKSFFVDTVVPAMPQNSAYLTDEGGDTLLNWDAASAGISGVAWYAVEERRGSSPLWVSVSTTSGRYLALTGPGGVKPLSLELSPGVYAFRVRPVNNAGVAGEPGAAVTLSVGLDLLATISDASAYPNPFDSRKRSVTIAFTLNKAAAVTVTIYDVFGRKVKTLGMAGSAGPNSITWDGSGPSGKVSMGMYLCVIKAVGDTEIVKVGVKH